MLLLKRILLLLLLASVLSGCMGRQSLVGEPFRLTAPVLGAALADVRAEVVSVDGRLRFGFINDNERLWYEVRPVEVIEDDGITIHVAEIDTGQRLRRPGAHVARIPIVSREEFADILRDVMTFYTPLGPDEGLSLTLRRGELVSWRDADGVLQLQSWDELPSHVRVVERIDDQQLATRVVRLLRDMLHHDPDNAIGQIIFSLQNDKPGAGGWIYADVEAGEIYYILSPFAGSALSEPALRVSLKTLDRVVFRSHVVTAIKNPVTTLRRLAGHGHDAVSSLIRRNPARASEIAPLHDGPGMDLEAWERRLYRITATRRYPGKLTFLVGGDQFFPELIEEIRAADREISIRTYIFDNDEYAVGLANLLRMRSEEVRVRVMMDDLGSLMAALKPPPGGHRADFIPPSDMVQYLSSGSAVKARRVGNPWLTGDHAKLTLIDRDLAYVGGMNYGEEYRYHWQDMMVRVEGRVVWRLQKEFEKAWAHAGPGGDLAYLLQSLRLPQIDPFGKEIEQDMVPVRVLRTRSGRREIHRAQLEAIRRAKSYIHIISPYFTEPDIINALIDARARGVDVRVVLPGEGNHDLMNSAHLFTANRLLDNGIRVFVYPGMTHVKAAVYDGWACFGSANFDRLSFKVNQEINLAVSDPATVSRLQAQLFEPHFGDSIELTEPLEWTWEDYAASLLSFPF
jgi:cardiolipin synthase A/B